MKIETLIKKINRYFVDKLICEDYELKEISSYTARVLVDDKHTFTIWIANDVDYCKCYDANINFMDLEFTDAEKLTLHTRFRKIWSDEQNRPEEIEKRRKEYLKLKAEFES